MLLALNEEKLTPFQTMKAFQKTRRLIIQQGMQPRMAQFKDNIASSKRLSSAALSKVEKNPHVLKMRSRQMRKTKSQNLQAEAHFTPKPAPEAIEVTA